MMIGDDELKEDDIEVEIEAEQPAEPAAASATGEQPPAADPAIEAIKAQVAEHEANLEKERSEKAAAEERARKAEAEAAVAKERVASSEIETLDAATAVVEREKDNAKRALKEAMEKGDFDGVISAQEQLAEHTYALKQLKEGKRALEQRASQRSAAPSTDPVETYISQFTPRSQNYLRQNIDFVKDPAKNKRLVAAHYEAEAEGLAADSDAYFEFLDAKLKPAAVEKTETRQSRRSTPAAPVSRGNDLSSGGSGSERKVKLTPNEARAATDGTIVWNTGPNKGKPIGVKEYARRKMLMADANSDQAS